MRGKGTTDVRWKADVNGEGMGYLVTTVQSLEADWHLIYVTNLCEQTSYFSQDAHLTQTGWLSCSSGKSVE